MPGSFDGGGLSRVELAALAKDLGKADLVMRRELPKRLRNAAKPVADAAKENAAGVSSKIRIGTRVKLAGRRGASVKVIGYSPENEPLAGLMERGNRGSSDAASFRHPVFGHTDRWVTQPTQPYLQPALEAHTDEAVAQCAEVITDVLIAMKFR